MTQLIQNNMKISKALATILWLIPIIFFVLLTLGFAPHPFERTIIERLIPLVFIVGTTILAWYLSIKHYPKVKDQTKKLVTLLFIPLVFIYGALFETSLNYGRFIRERSDNAMVEHLKFHLFNDTIILTAILLLVWLFFQKVPAGKWSLLFTFVIALTLQDFFSSTPEILDYKARIAFALVYVWLIHINWYFISLLFRPAKNNLLNINK